MFTIPEKLITIISEAVEEKVTGCIEIHFYQGVPSKVKTVVEKKI